MKILYFGNFMNPPDIREQSLLTKIYFKENVLKDIPLEWEETHLINEITKNPYNGLVLDLSKLKGNHSFERQYITRMVLRLIDDRPKTFFVALNDFTFECLVHESIKDLKKATNLFLIEPIQKRNANGFAVDQNGIIGLKAFVGAKK